MRSCGFVLAIVFGCSAAMAQDGGITVWPKGVPGREGCEAVIPVMLGWGFVGVKS